MTTLSPNRQKNPLRNSINHRVPHCVVWLVHVNYDGIVKTLYAVDCGMLLDFDMAWLTTQTWWDGRGYGLVRYTYEIRWAGVICIQTGLAGALLLSCREPHCPTFKQMHSAHFSAINILYTYKSWIAFFNYAGLQVTIIVRDAEKSFTICISNYFQFESFKWYFCISNIRHLP